MSQKTRKVNETINDPANCLLLRADLHHGYDELQFVFVPKTDGVLATNVLEPIPESLSLYHNANLYQNHIGPEFVFARFAYANSLLLSLFLQKGQPRHVNFAPQQEQRWVDAAECEELLIGHSVDPRLRADQTPLVQPSVPS